MCVLEGRPRAAMQLYFTETECIIIRLIRFLINFAVTSVSILNI